MLEQAHIEIIQLNLSGLFDQLKQETTWEQKEIRFMGKTYMQPRLTAWFGSSEYTYSGINHKAQKMTELLIRLKKIAEEKADCEFNSVLLNYYRDGNDSVSWHSDDEKELGEDPIIASMSFGGTRKFKLKAKDKSDKLDILLTDGSLLIMGSGTQRNYLHSIPKSKTYTEPRINITFRKILS